MEGKINKFYPSATRSNDKEEKQLWPQWAWTARGIKEGKNTSFVSKWLRMGACGSLQLTNVWCPNNVKESILDSLIISLELPAYRVSKSAKEPGVRKTSTC